MSEEDKKTTPPAVAATAAASTPEEPKGPLKEVKRPNDDKNRLNQEKLSKQIQTLSKELQGVKAGIDKLSGERGKGGPGGAEGQALRDELKGIQKELRAAFDAAKLFKDRLGKIDSERRTLFEELKKKKDDLPYSREEDIDREIARLEDQLMHSSMPINEEKKTVSRIGSLRSSKRAVGEQAAISAKIAATDDKKKEAQTELRANSDKIRALKEKEDKSRTKLNVIVDAAKAKRGDVPAMIKKRDELRKKISGLIEQQRKARDDVEKQWAAYKAYKKEADRIYKEERAARDAAREAGSDDEDADDSDDEGEEKVKKHPWASELTVCQDLIQYLEKLNRKAQSATASTAGASGSASSPKGEFPAELAGKTIGKKGTSASAGLDGMFAGKGAKKSKAQKTVSLEAKIKHSLEVLLFYSTIGLSAPSNLNAVANSLKEVRDKKEHYKSNPEKPKEDKADTPKKKNNNKAAAKKEGDIVAKGGPQPATAQTPVVGAWANRAVKA